MTLNSIFYEKPPSVHIPSLTKTILSESIEQLIQNLAERGPCIAMGKYGPNFYQNPCHLLKDKLQGRDLYGWQPGETRWNRGFGHVMILGAKKFSNASHVYFTDVEMKGCCKYAPSELDGKIYVVSYQKFQKYLYTLFPPCTANLTPINVQFPKERRQQAVETVQRVKRGWVEFSQRDPNLELERFQRDRHDLYQVVKDRFGWESHKDKIANACYMRALELFEALRDTHYCFLHGQSFGLYIHSLYITKMVEAKNPELAGKYRKFFRFPERLESAPRNVKEFIQSNPEIDDQFYGLFLLSVSGSPLAKERYESASSFFKDNRCIYHGFGELSSGQWKAALGALQLIAIPKEYVENEELCGVYNSYPKGMPIGTSIDLLRRQQKLEIMKGCSDQYRLLTSMLTFNPEILTVSLTELSKEEKRECYDYVQKYVDIKLKG